MTQLKQPTVFKGHDAAIYALAPGRKAHTVFSVGADKVVAEWNVQTKEPEPFSIRLEHPAYSMYHDRNQQILYCGNARGGIQVIDLKKKEEVRHFQTHKQGVFGIVGSGQKVYSSGAEGSICRWDGEHLSLEKQRGVSGQKIRSLLPLQNGPLLAAGNDGGIHILDPASLEEIHRYTPRGDAISAMAWHPAKKALITGGKDAFIRAFVTTDFIHFEEVMSIPAHNYPIYKIRISPDLKYIATASRDKTVKLWDGQSFDLLARLDRKTGGHSHSVNDIMWLNPQQLVSTGDDKRVILWDM